MQDYASVQKALRRIVPHSLILAAIVLLALPGAADVDWYASEVISYSDLGASPYNWAGAVLGKPTTLFRDPQIWACSMVVSSWQYAPPPYDPNDPNSGKIITTINPGGHIIVKFTTPIEDDPRNWYGLDFIVFGNSRFTSSDEDYITPTTDMEQCFIEDGGDGWWEPSPVSVSQDGITWYTFSDGPYADDFAPLQAFAWDNVNHTWGAELDFTKPLDPSLTQSDFGNLSVMQGIDLYKGSAGGAAFDISSLPLPTNANGRKWIQYIKVTGTRGEVDAFSRVGHTIDPVSVHDAKKLGDGKPVIMSETVVTAGSSELGDCCYAQSQNRPCGIKLKGRALSRGQIVTVYGVLTTDGDERAVNVTAIEPKGTGAPKPLGITNRNLGGGDQIDPATGLVLQSGIDGGRGLNTIGLLVRTWGKVGSVDKTARTWLVDDGSGSPIKCAAPPDPAFELPTENIHVAVTGICSCERNSLNEIVPVIRLRNQQDLN